MEFRILGPLEAVNDSGTIAALGGPRHRTLLAALLVHAGRAVSTDRLIEVIWGATPPKSATEMLQVRVSELRKLLSLEQSSKEDLLITRPPGYLIHVAPDELDSRRFEQLLASGRQALDGGEPAVAARHLRAAVALWRGPPLPEIADRPYAQSEIARLDDLRLQALEARIDADLATGRELELVGELRTLVAEHPLRERFWHRLMLALYRAGRQSEALQAYQSARDLLAEQLGIDPGPELQDLYTSILRQDSTLSPSPDPGDRRHETPTNLPANLTSFIGRVDELAEVAEQLKAVRLVTLTGVGGSGKSRLAVEIASRVLDAYPDGVWVVELAPLTDPRLIAATVAKVLGVPEHPERSHFNQVVTHLRRAKALVVLDNCEHLVEDVAEFTWQLLDACPLLRILCTSRERLGITGEVLRPLAGLRVPPPQLSQPAEARNTDAVRLFAERATAVRPTFDLSDTAAGVASEVCRRLDGLPLAIELAAAGISTRNVEQIAAGLDDRFHLLTRGSRVALPRHKTLRAVVDWSYELLDEPERRTFDRLAIFVGGFTFEAAEFVCAHQDNDLPEILARLVDKSLVTADAVASPEYRFRMLETLRAYGLERLEDRGELDTVSARHAGYFLVLAGAADIGLRGADQQAWLDRLSAEHSNFRAAMEFSLERGDHQAAACMAGSLYPFWDLRGHYSEGRQWLRRVLKAGRHVSERVRIRALMGAATLAVIQGDVEDAVATCEAAAALSRQTGNRAGLAHALQYLGFIAIYAEELEQADALLAESLEAARSADAQWEHGWALIFLATLALTRAEYDRAASLSRQSQMVLEPVGDQEALAWTMIICAGACWAQHKTDEAADNIRDALVAFDRLGGLWGISFALLVSALVTAQRGRMERSARLLAAAESIRTSMGVGMLPLTKAWFDDAITVARTALGADGFQTAWEAGSELRREAAVAEALSQLP